MTKLSSEEETENSTRWNVEEETTLTYDDENVHIIYPENSIQSRSKVSETQFYSEGVTEQVTTDNQLSSSTLSSAEQAENISQYKSGINDPEQKDSTQDKSTVVSSIEISQPLGHNETKNHSIILIIYPSMINFDYFRLS